MNRLKSERRKSLKIGDRRKIGGGVGDQSIGSRNHLDAVDESGGVLLRSEFDGELRICDVDKIFLDNGLVRVVDIEAVEKNVFVCGDGECGLLEIENIVVNWEEMESDPMETRVSHVERISSFLDEDPGRQIDGRRNIIGRWNGDLEIVLGFQELRRLRLGLEDSSVRGVGWIGCAAVDEEVVLGDE